MPQARIERIALTTRPALLTRIGRALTNALARRRDRQSLARLDQHLLRDIGLAPEDAATEAAKRFWQP